MNKIIFNADVMKFISLFETLTQARVKDCIEGEKLTFIVEENEIGKAIGKGGSNIRKMEGLLKKKIKIVEFNNDVREFIKSYIHPLQVKEIAVENDEIVITGNDVKSKGLLIGRDRKNIENLKSIVKRYFRVDDIKVV